MITVDEKTAIVGVAKLGDRVAEVLKQLKNKKMEPVTLDVTVQPLLLTAEDH